MPRPATYRPLLLLQNNPGMVWDSEGKASSVLSNTRIPLGYSGLGIRDDGVCGNAARESDQDGFPFGARHGPNPTSDPGQALSCYAECRPRRVSRRHPPALRLREV